MAGGTIVQYGNVRIKDCETLSFNQEVVYDESGTDTIFSKFHIRVSGSLHADQLATHAISFGAAALPGVTATLAASLQAQLSHPRQDFYYIVDGVTVLYVTCQPPDGTTLGGLFSDVNNGPKPLRVDVTKVVGAKLFRVEFEIELAVVKCFDLAGSSLPNWPPAGTGTHTAVLNNRWSVAETRDGNFFSTVTTQGLLRISHASFCPHFFRYLCVPGLQLGYRRESMTFHDSPDGLTLRYTIVDRQKTAAPPSPAVDWYATYSESCGIGGAVGFGEMRIVLDGAPNCKPLELLEAAFCVMFCRLRGLLLTSDNKMSSILQSLNIVEHLHQPRIELSARVQHVGTVSANDPADPIYLNTRIGRIGKTLDDNTISTVGSNPFADYKAEEWPVLTSYASTETSARWAHYWQDPCVSVHGMPNNISYAPEPVEALPSQRDPRDYPPEPIFNPPSPPTEPPSASQPPTTGHNYTYYHVETDYEVECGTVALPIAAWDGDTATTNAQATAFISTSRPQGERTIHIHAERIGQWPTLPVPYTYFTDLNQIGYALAWVKYYPTTPWLLPDGRSKLYRMQMRARYYMTRSPGATDRLLIGADPRILPAATDQIVDFSQTFSTELPL